MKKPGRNEPCLCGSGRKYKKCCLHTSKLNTGGTLVYTDLDDLSNQVPGLIKQGKYDEAEEVCQTLLEQYPAQIDGLHRSAELFEAMEDYSKAATFYKLTANFAEQAEGFGKESVEFFRNRADQLHGADK